MKNNLFKLGSCSSNIYTKGDRICKEIILSNKEDEIAIKKGINLIINYEPKSILEPLDIEFNNKSHQGKDFIECKYEQSIQKPWIPHEWISSIQLYDLASLILKQEELLISNDLTFVDARASNYHLYNDLKLIDLGSFKNLNKHSYYSFETDFTNNFLTPLLLEKKLNISIGSYFAGKLESTGINTLYLNNLFLNPGYTIFNLKRLLKEFISTKISQSNTEFVDFLIQENPELPKTDPKKALKKLKLLKNLLLSSKPAPPGKTTWSEYSSFHLKDYSENKSAKINEFISLVPENSSIVDLGSNIGSSQSKSIKAFIDRDVDVCNYLRQTVDSNQIVLCADIAQELLNTINNNGSELLNISGDIENAIVMSLLHHIIIDAGLNVQAFYKALSKLYKNVLLEFITDEDPMIKFLIKKKGEIINWSWQFHSEIASNYFNLTDPIYLSPTRFVVTLNNKK